MIWFLLNCCTNNALISIIENIQTQMIIYMLQGFLLTWKKLLIQLSITYSLKNWIIGVRGVAKDWFISYQKGRRQFVINPRNLNRSSTRLSYRSIIFPHFHQWSGQNRSFGKTNEQRCIKSIIMFKSQ